ncbi:hypothetical protein P1P75_21855 [Streptomyces sp. ID05-39B]|uniref:hypothetical protein n=1 Tax=Streptomyces sp. ID05-39B TaxID=3028664 RepID=UPI0029B34D74|nr:hypothetical protein [Streptomyces sp. ID05-39B]MDX3529002.1 hypothetical protein [Streptomyces sp. ID05-39B]
MTTTPVSGRTGSAQAGRAAAGGETVDIRLGTPSRARGRHRRPRPRKALFTTGGFALAVGALSLLRLTADSGVDTAEAGPRLQPTADTLSKTDTADATDAAATVSGSPGPTTTAPAPTGNGGTVPSGVAVPGAAPTSAVRTPSGPYTPRTRSPADEGTPAPAATPSSGSTAPRPPGPTSTPAPEPGTDPPAAGPTSRPGLCLPVVGLCVDALDAPAVLPGSRD